MSLTRRRLLAGLGAGAGAALLGPFFRQAFASQGGPCRFVIVMEGNCIEPSALMSPDTRAALQAQTSDDLTGRRWMPREYGHTSTMTVNTGDLASARALSALAAGPSAIDLVSRSAVVLGLSSTITGGGHTTHFGALSSTRSTPARPSGPTIDAVLAAVPGVRGITPFDAVRVGIDDSSNRLGNVSCAFEEGRSAPVTLDPDLVYANLFGFVEGSSGHDAFQKRSDLLDFAHTDVTEALGAFSGNSAERAKLEAYLSSIEVVRQRQDDLQALAATYDPTNPFPAPEDPSTNPLYASSDKLDRLQAQFDNVQAALIGGLTNVAVITSGTGGGFSRMTYQEILQNYGSIDTNLERHDLHHGSGGQQDWIDAIHDVSGAHVQRIAGLARALDAVPELTAPGTMLDHTLIVYLPDNGEQHHSQAMEWPVLLIGGSALGFQTDGRSVIYPGIDQTNNRQLSNLFNTLGHSVGLDLNDFGKEGETRIAEGPLSEIWA